MKKQITIEGKNSDWFEKAVFILKEDCNSIRPKNILNYADFLVEMYLKKNDEVQKEAIQKYSQEMQRGKTIKRQRQKNSVIKNLILDSLMFLSFVAMGFVLYEMLV